ncbi:MAG: hypothetical protein IT426_18345 [Pirellulales bacterium]|nr:hypothetical protein [Pirellulales bacterium]
MTICGKTPQWDEVLSAIDEWVAEAKPALETLHFVHEGIAGYSVPLDRFLPRLHKILDGCRFMAPGIDIHPLADLSAELCHPENPPRPHYREWIRDLWTKCERIIERLRDEGGVTQADKIPQYQNSLDYKTLTDIEKSVLDYLVKDGPRSGKEICNACGIEDESSLRTHVIRKLKSVFPVKNRKTVGYYLDWNKSAQ